jgi:hypothetical protein
VSGNKEFDAWAAKNVEPTNDGPKVPESIRINSEIERTRLVLTAAQAAIDAQGITDAANRLNDLTAALVEAVRSEEASVFPIGDPKMETTRRTKDYVRAAHEEGRDCLQASCPICQARHRKIEIASAPRVEIEVARSPRPVPEDDCRRDLISAAKDIISAKRISEMDSAVKMMRALCEEWGEREPKWSGS